MTTFRVPTLRPYQERSVAQTRRLLAEGKRVMLQCPTGSGKTEMAIVLVQEWLTQGALARDAAGKPLLPRVLWLTHREELRRQTGSRFEQYGVRTANLPDLPREQRAIRRGVLSVVSPSIRDLDAFTSQAGQRDLLVVDEAHHAPANTWEQLITDWPGAVLGLTATPWRLNTKEGFTHLFNSLVTGPSIDSLRDEGYLAGYTLYAPKDEGVRIVGKRVRAGDYALDDIDVRALATDKVVDLWRTHKPENARTVWYVPTTAAARQLEETLARSNMQAVVVLADTDPAVRGPALARFGRGEIEHVINVMTLMEGIDVPEANCIVFARPTKSLVIFLQAMGRGLRPMKGKEAALIDLGHSFNNFGVHPFGQIPWSLEPRKEQSNGEPPMKVCPGCETVIYTGFQACPRCQTSLGEACAQCHRFTFYESAGYRGENKMLLAMLKAHATHNAVGNPVILNNAISALQQQANGDLLCLDCAHVQMVERKIPWVLGPVAGHKVAYAPSQYFGNQAAALYRQLASKVRSFLGNKQRGSEKARTDRIDDVDTEYPVSSFDEEPQKTKRDETLEAEAAAMRDEFNLKTREMFTFAGRCRGVLLNVESKTFGANARKGFARQKALITNDLKRIWEPTVAHKTKTSIKIKEGTITEFRIFSDDSALIWLEASSGEQKLVVRLKGTGDYKLLMLELNRAE